jgi:hypothetical protein
VLGMLFDQTILHKCKDLEKIALEEAKRIFEENY